MFGLCKYYFFPFRSPSDAAYGPRSSRPDRVDRREEGVTIKHVHFISESLFDKITPYRGGETVHNRTRIVRTGFAPVLFLFSFFRRCRLAGGEIRYRDRRGDLKNRL